MLIDTLVTSFYSFPHRALTDRTEALNDFGKRGYKLLTTVSFKDGNETIIVVTLQLVA